jgi:4-nitrophenyl phosphatase
MPVLDSYPQIRGVILDMDGVLWKDSQPIGDLPAIFARFNELGLKVTLATNNATKTVDEFCQKILGFGVEVSPWQIVNSSMAAGYYLQKHFSSRGKVFVVGEAGLRNTLKEYGYEAVENPQGHNILAVVAGMDRSLTYDKLRKAALLIRSGCPFIGTNPDQTFPTPEGLVPGAGSILALLETATSVKPIIAGKPSPTLFNLALERMELSARETLTVGDRMDTDIAGGQVVGCLTAAVLSGVSTVQDVQAWRPKPDIIIADLSSLVGIPHSAG